MNNPKSVAELERQKLFEALRHYISSKHQAPAHLTKSDLLAVLGVLLGETV